MTYPSSHVPAGGGVYNPVAGVQAVYGRNALSQMNSLTVGGQSVVTSAYYNTAGQLQQLNWDGWTEDRWYNTAGQMWKQQIKAGSTVIGGWEYYFPASGNNGRITGTKDLQSLEEITYQYDSLNRLVSATKTGGGWGEEVTFWGPAGRLATYRIDTISNGTMYFVEQTRNVWFGSRLLRTGPAATPTKLATDRLGSIRLRQTGANPIEYLTYAPYGEQRSGPSGESEKFATYYRDQTNLDYADQRYFSGNWGRFSTPDPYRASAASSAPQTWNRYSYGEANPISNSDPDGLDVTCKDVAGVLTCRADVVATPSVHEQVCTLPTGQLAKGIICEATYRGIDSTFHPGIIHQEPPNMNDPSVSVAYTTMNMRAQAVIGVATLSSPCKDRIGAGVPGGVDNLVDIAGSAIVINVLSPEGSAPISSVYGDPNDPTFQGVSISSQLGGASGNAFVLPGACVPAVFLLSGFYGPGRGQRDYQITMVHELLHLAMNHDRPETTALTAHRQVATLLGIPINEDMNSSLLSNAISRTLKEGACPVEPR